MTASIRDFLETMPPETPCLIVDLEVVRAKYHELRAHFRSSSIHYALKANPAPEVLRAIEVLGSNFNVASPAEIELCLRLGIAPERLSYGNTVKKSTDIAFAYRCGVRDFAFDSHGELEKLSAHAPGSRVLCRLMSSGEGADWPLSRKFGCDPDTAFGLMVRARDLGLEPDGLSFHVGSQQTNPRAWDAPLREAAQLFARHQPRWRAARPLYPAHAARERVRQGHRGRARARLRARAAHPDARVRRSGLVAEAGVIKTEFVLISHSGEDQALRWVYLDVGVFGGLIETLGEAIAYPIRSHRAGRHGPVVLAGPTCDSADVLYERTPHALPLSLEVGDRITIGSAGAYTAPYASVGFNGLAPMPVYCVGDLRASPQEVIACTR